MKTLYGQPSAGRVTSSFHAQASGSRVDCCSSAISQRTSEAKATNLHTPSQMISASSSYVPAINVRYLTWGTQSCALSLVTTTRRTGPHQHRLIHVGASSWSLWIRPTESCAFVWALCLRKKMASIFCHPWECPRFVRFYRMQPFLSTSRSTSIYRWTVGARRVVTSVFHCLPLGYGGYRQVW